MSVLERHAGKFGRRRPADAIDVAADGAVVWISGVSWDAVIGTDRQLVSSLARHRPIIWVDPPMSWLARRRRGMTVGPVTRPALGITRIHTVAPPGVTRPGIRTTARWMMWRNVRRAMAQLADGVAAIVVTSPDPVMPMFRRSRAAKIYYATDDFVAGADLFGYSTDFARRARTANTRHSDLTLAVSEQLGGIMLRTARRVAVLPNGCDSAAFDRVPGLKRSPDVTLPSPVAGVVGQLNDRLDLDLLEAVGRTGDSLLLIGPRYEESAEATSRLDGLIARPNVQWMDRQPFDRLPELFASIDVGLTPYLDNEFNRSSFPLKTLEYLAAGRPVVTTDLPSVRSLDLELVTCARGADAFAAAVHLALRAPDRADLVPRRQAFARMHRWDARANELNEILKDIARISENRRDN